MVGDWPEKDMIGAKNSGLIACFAKYGQTEELDAKVEADHTIHRIEEIFEIVGQPVNSIEDVFKSNVTVIIRRRKTRYGYE